MSFFSYSWMQKRCIKVGCCEDERDRQALAPHGVIETNKRIYSISRTCAGHMNHPNNVGCFSSKRGLKEMFLCIYLVNVCKGGARVQRKA